MPVKCFALTLDNCFNVSVPPDVTAHVRYKDFEVSNVADEGALLNQLCVYDLHLSTVSSLFIALFHFYTCAQ